MSDVLVVTTPLPGAYPSVGHTGRTGFKGGRKTPQYLDLFRAIEAEAQSEMARVGWVTADYLCDVRIVLYHARASAPDASNLGKCELDSLTAAGVWTDDELARPFAANTQYDPAGEPRVVVVIQRTYPPLTSKPSPIVVEARRIARLPKGVVVVDAPPLKWASVDGKRVPYDQAMREIRAGKMR